MRVARSVDGTLRACPASFRNFTESRQCISAPYGAEVVKQRLNKGLGDELVTAWRAQSNPVYAYNYVRHENEVVGVVVGPLAKDGSSSILVLDAVPEKAEARPATPNVRIVPKAEPTTATQPKSEPATTTQPKTGGTTSRPAPAASSPAFTRELALRAPRVNGEDVRTLQNRLMDVARIPRGSGGDGWYGPVTAATVRAFQRANGLPDTGRVDRATWERLFSTRAKGFDPEDVTALLGR